MVLIFEIRKIWIFGLLVFWSVALRVRLNNGMCDTIEKIARTK
jgi:hypothetical protein